MSEPKYNILEAQDGTFQVEVYDGTGSSDFIVDKFVSRKNAEDWIKEERLKHGTDTRWPEASDD